jgi:hypothetical protein
VLEEKAQEAQQAHLNSSNKRIIDTDTIVKTVTSHINALNYDGIEFSDMPNFSTDTSIMDEEEDIAKKHINVVKRIIQTQE